MSQVTIAGLLEMKRAGQKITMLTAYDYTMAGILDKAGIDILLIGDSLGMVLLGYKNTLAVTLEEILLHTKAVSKASDRSLVVADMPFLSYKVNIADSVYNAGRLIKEGGAKAVKLEGGTEIIDTIEAMIKADIPVMGHIGLTPQAIHKLGGYRVTGRKSQEAKKLKEDALTLSMAGVFAIVLECIPAELAKEISETISVPIIGIGAGVHCDGQVLVIHDLLGLYEHVDPKFVRRYANLKVAISEAVEGFISDVKKGNFPSEEESYI